MRRTFAPAVRALFERALDLGSLTVGSTGQVNDYSALAVVERVQVLPARASPESCLISRIGYRGAQREAQGGPRKESDEDERVMIRGTSGAFSDGRRRDVVGELRDRELRQAGEALDKALVLWAPLL